MLRQSGYTRDEITQIGNVGYLYFDANERAEALAIAQKQGFLRRHQVRFKRKDGTPYPTLLSLDPVTINGQPCWQALVEDISERKGGEETIHRLASIVKASTDAIMAVSLEDTITIWNPGAERIYGYTAEEVIGHPTSMLRPPDRASRRREVHD
jgi:PAS domain S-box-containing protein